MTTGAGAAPSSWLDHLDRAPLTRRYWLLFAIITLSAILEFFDFFVVGFIVAVIGPEWKLTYGQSAMMLLSGGVGSIVGALISGFLADAFGRKKLFVATAIICGIGSLVLSMAPEGSWAVFSLIRFFIGFGLGGAATVQNPLLVEFTPTRLRSMMPGIGVALGSMGIFAASLSAATLMEHIGWRGLALIGALPILLGLLAIVLVPESIRWLAAKGRVAEAQKVAALFVGPGMNLAAITPVASAGALEAVEPTAKGQTGRLVLVFVAWLGVSTATYGIYLWGPTILALLLGIGVKQAAQSFVLVSLGGLTGKAVFALIPQFIGRRPSAQIAGFGGAICLIAAAYFNAAFLGGGVSVFLLFLIGAAFFVEGGYANLSPFTAEMFPVSSAGRAVGLAQAANGLGKVLGPLSLAVIAGAGDYLAPKATQHAVLPGFTFLGLCALAAGTAFLVSKVETHGRKLALS